MVSTLMIKHRTILDFETSVFNKEKISLTGHDEVSFMNAITTIKGVTHVDYITNQITTHIMSVVNKKNKNANLKAHAIKNHLWVFVNSLIDNPAFDSQSSFGSKCELSQEVLKKVTKSGVVESLLSWADFKQNKDLKKTDGTKKNKITGVPKLDDANDAGVVQSHKCTLNLTEGDSAKALAMAGLFVSGRNYYGVFPLRAAPPHREPPKQQSRHVGNHRRVPSEVISNKPAPRRPSIDVTNDNAASKDVGNNNIAAQAFTFQQLATATKTIERVYKGKLDKIGQVVAVKQLDRNGLQENKDFLVVISLVSLLEFSISS